MPREAGCRERLSVDGDGLVVYQLKHPFRDGTTHVLFEPLDFIAFSHEDCVFMLPGETFAGCSRSTSVLARAAVATCVSSPPSHSRR